MHSTPEFDERFKQLYAKGYSGIEMSKMMGVHFKAEQCSVYTLATAWMIRHVKRMGLPRRGKGCKLTKSPNQLRKIARKKERQRQKRIAQLKRNIPKYEALIQKWRDELASFGAE